MLKSVINKRKKNIKNATLEAQFLENSSNQIYIKNDYGSRSVPSRSVHRSNQYYISGVKSTQNTILYSCLLYTSPSPRDRS